MSSAEEFKKFSNATVPLARLRQRVFTNADKFDVDVELAHYGPEPIERGLAVWKIARYQLQGRMGSAYDSNRKELSAREEYLSIFSSYTRRQNTS